MSSVTAQPPPSPKTWHGPPPPPELIDKSSSLELLSQGAEARVWLVTIPQTPESNDNDNENSNSSRKRTIHVGSGINVPQLLSFSQHPSPLPSQTSQSTPLKVICKERFPKKYRHPQLDTSLTKSRTKGEARSLIRCQRADVPCTNVLAIAHWSNGSEISKENAASGKNGKSVTEMSTISSCLFLEYVDGCTVRQYFEKRSEESPKNNETKDGDNGAEPDKKRPRSEEATANTESNESKQQDRVTTVIDTQTLCVAHTIGSLVAKMHAAGIIHGDLTTSNVMIRNPPWLCGDGDTSNNNAETSWKPQLVLIDFGLATSTASSNKTKNNNTAGNKKAKPQKQQHNAEEKAVDLYVLERAFLSTHPESEPLVEEVWKGYRSYFENLDREDADGVIGDGGEIDTAAIGEGSHFLIAKAVLNRLEQVRMRGRKRECFG